MKRILLVAISAVALLSTACGGGKSCSDACNAVYNCLKTQGLAGAIPTDFVNTCTQSCNATNCSNKQKVIDCVAGAKCDANLASISACDTTGTCI